MRGADSCASGKIGTGCGPSEYQVVSDDAGPLQQTGRSNADRESRSGGPQGVFGAERSDGSVFGPAGGRMAGSGPEFDAPVAPGGYAWWYVDALSDDGKHGLSIISFIGSVFSPYYKFARRKPHADPENHIAINVALYGAGGHRWTMTERGRRELAHTADTLVVGPSSLRWDGIGLTFEIDEITVPFPSRLKGCVRVIPSGLNRHSFAIDTKGEHHWRPIAPVSRVEVAFENGLKWSGNGYFDWNGGKVPLEESFRRWDWSRSSDRDGATIFYDVSLKDGRHEGLALFIHPDGAIVETDPPPLCALPPSPIWRVVRGTRSDANFRGTIVKTLEDTPFYARSIVSSHVAERPVTAMHESLSLDRFVSPIVQCMLPFRMPRRAGR
jgi:carotenoid 1,2-hydratase